MSKNLTLLWSGSFISKLGDNFFTIALAWWILEKTHSPAVMGIYLAFSTLPGLLIGIFAGAYIDRLRAKFILITTDLLRGFIILGMTVLFLTNHLGIIQVVISTAILSIASAFYDPTAQSIIPRIVSIEDIPKANARMMLIDGITTVLGPVIGASFVTLLRYEWVFLINATSFFISAGLEGFMQIAARTTPISDKKILWDIKEGINYILTSKKLVTIIITIGIAHFFIGALLVTLPFLATQISGDGVYNLGFLQMNLGIGFIVGSVIMSKKKRHLFKEYLFISFNVIYRSMFRRIRIHFLL